MEFFIPNSKNTETSEKVYKALIESNNAIITKKRIYKIIFDDKGKRMTAQVGKQIDKHYKEENQTVIAIVETESLYCICTSSRGIVAGVPIYIGKNEYNIALEYFD